MTGRIAAFEASRQKTNLWLKDVAAELHSSDRRRAYAALRAVLHALRDCLPIEETAKFAAQMPMLIQGMLYEGWKPHRKPQRMSREGFFARLRECTRFQPGLEPALAARAVFIALAEHLSAGEIESVRRVLPRDVRDLWYELGHFPPSQVDVRDAGISRALREGAVDEPEGPDSAHEARMDAMPGDAMPTDAFKAYEPGSHGSPAWP